MIWAYSQGESILNYLGHPRDMRLRDQTNPLVVEISLQTMDVAALLSIYRYNCFIGHWYPIMIVTTGCPIRTPNSPNEPNSSNLKHRLDLNSSRVIKGLKFRIKALDLVTLIWTEVLPLGNLLHQPIQIMRSTTSTQWYSLWYLSKRFEPISRSPAHIYHFIQPKCIYRSFLQKILQ